MTILSNLRSHLAHVCGARDAARTYSLVICLLMLALNVRGQASTSRLTVDKIMRDPKWIGTSPTSPFWSPDSKVIYFNWNPENATADSLYFATNIDRAPRKVGHQERINMPGRIIRYDKLVTRGTYEKNGDIFLIEVATKKVTQITNTSTNELDPNFSADEKKISFFSGVNLFEWEIETGKLKQLTDFRAGTKSVTTLSEQEKWLKRDQLRTSAVLQERETKNAQRKKNLKAEAQPKPKEIFIDDRTVELVRLSPNEKFVTYRLSAKSNSKTTVVPNFVTNSGFTEDIAARTKVGIASTPSELFLYDIQKDTAVIIKLDDLPGIHDTLSFFKDYTTKSRSPKTRQVEVTSAEWSSDGSKCLFSMAALDFKDRWIMSLDPASRNLTLLYREHDDAWVNSPIGDFVHYDNVGWLADGKRIWFTSEESGFSHLYVLDIESKKKQALTSGQFEVQNVVLSRNKETFYLITNASNPGEKQVYKLSSRGGKLERITAAPGAYEMSLSPDEKWFALRYSYSNKPWELFLAENKAGGKIWQITNSLTDEFKSYAWRDPEVITFKARDSANVYARIYKPDRANGAGVVFVHGAGYLQNAHKWWSSYFREYMFNNLLADLGYTVLDIDYRASAGYGRDWRTGIYRHMGGKDLTDNLDGAKLLVDQYGIDPQRIGIYGGSYGGFITLMAMFTAPDVFAAGAALRPVTDWAHYNHPYTGSILNTPYLDSLSYAKSSPLYYAEGLKGALLICHGMVDTNVHFQDAVRLAQRLIELGKDNWELAGYPVEDHAFVEPSSWTDEYKRILKLFQQNLKPN